MRKEYILAGILAPLQLLGSFILILCWDPYTNTIIITELLTLPLAIIGALVGAGTIQRYRTPTFARYFHFLATGVYLLGIIIYWCNAYLPFPHNYSLGILSMEVIAASALILLPTTIVNYWLSVKSHPDKTK